MVERFQTTHEYIKNVYRHSKGESDSFFEEKKKRSTFTDFVHCSDNLLPPGDEMADLHDRVKHFCGVKNEELLEKLK